MVSGSRRTALKGIKSLAFRMQIYMIIGCHHTERWYVAAALHHSEEKHFDCLCGDNKTTGAQSFCTCGVFSHVFFMHEIRHGGDINAPCRTLYENIMSLNWSSKLFLRRDVQSSELTCLQLILNRTLLYKCVYCYPADRPCWLCMMFTVDVTGGYIVSQIVFSEWSGGSK